jgi:hypothetical protein
MRPIWLLALSACSTGLTALEDKAPVVADAVVDTGTGGGTDTVTSGDDDDDVTAPGDDDDDVGTDTAPTDTGEPYTPPTTTTPVTTDTGTLNRPPVADAGPDQLVFVLDRVDLDGSFSSDPDGDPLTYSWTWVTPVGSGSNLANENTATPSFYPDREGDYELTLTVDDGMSSATDTVIVTAEEENEAPIADAGFNQTVEVGRTVFLDGGGSVDPNGDPLNYYWTITQKPGGSNAQLDDDRIRDPSFVADVVGGYVIELYVHDGQAQSPTDEVRVTAESPPDSGGGGDDCFGCAQAELELQRRVNVGDAAGSAGLVLLPVMLLLYQRRRDSI